MAGSPTTAKEREEAGEPNVRKREREKEEGAPAAQVWFLN